MFSRKLRVQPRARLFLLAGLCGLGLPAAPAAAATAAQGEAQAEEGFSIGATFRATAEVIDGQFRPGRAEDDFFLSFRTNVLAQYDFGPVRLVGELSDARGYGQKRNSSVGTSEINALEPLQAFVAVDLDEAIGHGFSGALQAGRFTMDIGSGRLIARADSSNSPAAFTGALLDMETPSHDRVHLFWTMPNTRLPQDAESLRDNEVELDRSTSDVQFYGASFTRPELFGEVAGQVYVYALHERDAAGYPTRNRDIVSYGARLNREAGHGPFDFDVEYVRQVGEIRATAAASDLVEIDVGAHFLHAEIGRKFSRPWAPRLSVHFDLATGDGPGADYGRFDPLFGSRRSEFGNTSLYGPLSRANIVSPGLRFEAKPGARTDFMLMYRAVWLEEATDSLAATGVRDRTGASGSWGGHQLEGRVRHWLVPGRLRGELGAAWLGKGRFLSDAPNAPRTGDTHYAYMALNASF